MNKKGFWGELGSFVIIVLLVILIILLFRSSLKEYKELKEYASFCAARPNFCYCEGGLLPNCAFKTSSSFHCINGNCSDTLSPDTQALCDLALKLDDKKTLFNTGCS